MIVFCGAPHPDPDRPLALYVWVYPNGVRALLCERHLADRLPDVWIGRAETPKAIALVSQ